jgi:methyltransferase (TIGR00027 family)
MSLWTAYLRAWHARNDAPLIFDDPLSGELVEGQLTNEVASVEKLASLLTVPRPARASLPERARELLEHLARIDPVACEPSPDLGAAARWVVRRVLPTALMVSRARYAEDALAAEARRGLAQYVVIGAGMDTFAFRRPVELARVRVIEVDHPATQAFKLRRIGELGWPRPPGVEFVALDLTSGELAAALARASFDTASPALFGWLGVTYYLRSDALQATFRAIAEVAAPGSTVVFDYFHPGAYEDANPRKPFVIGEAERVGEPLRSGIDPATLAAELAAAGLILEEDLGPEEINARWFQGRSDGFRALPFAHLARAVVARR